MAEETDEMMLESASFWSVLGSITLDSDDDEDDAIPDESPLS